MQDQDREIIRDLLKPASSERAFTQLVEIYQKPLYAHIRRMVGNHDDADDVLQNTFIKVWRYAAGFKGDSALFTWLYRIATNEALGFIRAQKPAMESEINKEIQPAGNTDGPDGDEISRKLAAALLTLPEKQRQVFDLKYFSEMTYEEISIITGTSVGGLKASYFHAVKKIEAALTS